MSQEERQAIDERKALIESRARLLAEEAIANGEAWARRLGDQPADSRSRERWVLAASTVAAYRDRYKLTGDLPVGGRAVTDAQLADRQRALRAARTAKAATERGRRRDALTAGAQTIFSP